MRAVEHRVVLVDGRICLLAADDEAGQLRLATDSLSDDLIDTRSGANRAAGGERRAREQIARLRTVDVSLEGFGIVEPTDEQHAISKTVKRLEHAAELHRLALPFGPPLAAVKPAAREEDGHPGRSVARLVVSARLVSPDSERLHPRKCHRNAEPAKHRPAGESMCRHLEFLLLRRREPWASVNLRDRLSRLWPSLRVRGCDGTAGWSRWHR